MRVTYPPAVTKAWSLAELRALVGLYVSVEVSPAEGYQPPAGETSRWGGGSGVCIDAGRTSGNTFVSWDYGMGWTWPDASGAYISVCDEHGEHRVRWTGERLVDAGDAGAAECLATFGVRFSTPAAQGG